MEILIVIIIAVAGYFAFKFFMKELASTKTMNSLDRNMALSLEISSAQKTADYKHDINTKGIDHNDVVATQETLLFGPQHANKAAK